VGGIGRAVRVAAGGVVPKVWAATGLVPAIKFSTATSHAVRKTSLAVFMVVFSIFKGRRNHVLADVKPSAKITKKPAEILTAEAPPPGCSLRCGGKPQTFFVLKLSFATGFE
jgi:hypothetical protein